jgi:hypothetical protein
MRDENNMETLIGKQPESKFNASGILKPALLKFRDITANIVAISTYQEASKIMTKNFAGQEFGSAQRKKVQNAAIWHKRKNVLVY